MKDLSRFYYEINVLKELTNELKEELLNSFLYKQIQKVEESLIEVKNKLASNKEDILKNVLISLGYECRTGHTIHITIHDGKVGTNIPNDKYLYLIIHKNRPKLLSIQEFHKSNLGLIETETKWEGIGIHYSETYLECSGLGIKGYGSNEELAWNIAIGWLEEEYGIDNSSEIEYIKDSFINTDRVNTLLQLLFILPIQVRQRVFNEVINVYVNGNNKELARELILTLPKEWVIKELYRSNNNSLINEFY